MLIILILYCTPYSESEEEPEAVNGKPGTNTLKEQLQKQRKKIIGHSFND